MASHKCRALIVSTVSLFLMAGSALAQNNAPAAPAKVEPAKVQPTKVKETAKEAAKDPNKGGQPDMQAMQEIMTKAAAVGEHHKFLAAFAGEWEGTAKMWMDPAGTPIESPTSCVSKMEMDGRYLYSHYTGDMMGQKFKGVGIIGYNNTTKEFETSWIDNMGTGVETSTGKCSADGKEFTFTGQMTEPMAGKKIASREVMKWTNADTFVNEFYMPGPDGKEMKAMEITLHRKGTAGKALKDAKDEAKKEIKDAVKEKLPAVVPPKK